MKRSWITAALLAVYALSILAIALPSIVEASASATSLDVKVDHVVEIRESGVLVINDTVTLSKLGDGIELPEDYVIGFPFTYQYDLAYAFAYETSNPSSGLNLELDAGLGRIGFYGVSIGLHQAVDKFTVVFVFSDSVSFSVSTFDGTQVVFYNASFPAYPSLPQSATQVDLKVIMPTSLNYTSSSFEQEGISFAETVEGVSRVFSYVKSNLTEFSDQPAWFSASRTSDSAQLLDVNQVERKVEILGNEQISVSDSYKIVNRAGELGKIRLKLPAESHSISAFDEFGLIPDKDLKIEQAEAYTNVTITFSIPHAEGDEVFISVHYGLPWKKHVTVNTLGEFHVSLSLFEKPDWVIRKLLVTVVLPEGASLSSPVSPENLTELQKAAFLSSLTFAFQNATSFHDFSSDLTYQRQIFWDSFRPTLWMGAFVLFVGALVAAWRIYQPPPAAPLPTAIVTVRAEDLNNFVNRYDEKRRLLRETESLEAAARKGKIPRRQYKVRKMTIDSRLTSLSRDLAALRDKLRTAGPRYAELMRQLEIAETDLESVKADIGRTEIRYRRGEISAAAYHKLLEDSYRRRDRAQTTIDGALLRLREEMT